MKKINIILRQYTEHSGIIWVSFYINREKVNFSTKVECDPKHWDAKNTRVKSTDKTAKDKNLIIENILARINNVLVKYRLKDKKITKAIFLRAYHRPDDYETFFEFYTDYMKKNSFKIEGSTFHTHNCVLNKLKRFAPNLHFDDIDKEWLDTYYSFLRKDLENTESTATKNMAVLKKYIRAAWKAGYIEENPFDEWKIKRAKSVGYKYLHEDELNKLVNAYTNGELEHKYHETLEFFLFMCFSSLHIGDARKLKLENFSAEYFTYFRIKNKNSKPEPIQVPISGSLRKIIKNVVGNRKQGMIFNNLPADQTMNRYLKKVGEILEIFEFDKLSHKAGRHTFATFYLAKTKDLASLKEILGHSELRETLIYAHVLDESKQEGIKFFDEFNL